MSIRIDVVDNGGQWTHREWRVLKYIGADTRIIPNTTPIDELEADGLVLSGGAPRVNLEAAKLGAIGDYLDDGQVPILAICVGLQYMCIHMGGRAGPGEVPEFGRIDIQVLDEDTLFRGIPERFVAWVSHNDEVKVLPEGFRAIARSETCPVEAVAHESLPLFGTQFHPEVEHTEHGYELFKNFMAYVDEHRRG